MDFREWLFVSAVIMFLLPLVAMPFMVTGEWEKIWRWIKRI